MNIEVDTPGIGNVVMYIDEHAMVNEDMPEEMKAVIEKEIRETLESFLLVAAGSTVAKPVFVEMVYERLRKVMKETTALIVMAATE